MPPRKTTGTTTRTGRRTQAEVTDLLAETGEAETPDMQALETLVEERREATTPARRAAREKHDEEVLQSVADLAGDQAQARVQELRRQLIESLDAAGEAIMDAAATLARLQEACRIRTAELKELHHVEVAADSLERLVAQHREARASFEREMAEARAAWEKERKAWQESFEAEKDKARREWQREREEYEYATKTRRARDEEAYQAQVATQQARLAEERARQEKELAAREAAVAAREREFEDLRARVATFDAALAEAVEKARVEATAAAEEKARHRAEIRAKETEAEIRVLNLRVEGLQQTVTEQAKRIALLERELKEATDKVRDVAMKAIEGASGAAALAHVSEIAMKQAGARHDD